MQATWVLIIGYSWINGHLLVVGNPGIGWPVAYKRCITVLIGTLQNHNRTLVAHAATRIRRCCLFHFDDAPAQIRPQSRPSEKRFYPYAAIVVVL